MCLLAPTLQPTAAEHSKLTHRKGECRLFEKKNPISVLGHYDSIPMSQQ